MRRLVLMVRLRRNRWGRLDCFPDLAAAAVAAAAGARLVTAGPAGTVPEWARDLARSRPDAVVLVSDRSTRAVAEALGDGLAGRGVSVAHAEPDGDRARLVHRGGAGPELVAEADLGRLYRSGAVAAAQAARLGVPVGEETIEELRHIAARSAASMTVPLIANGDTDWRDLAERLRRAADQGPRLPLLHPRIDPDAVDAEVAAAVSSFATGGVTVEATADRTDVGRVRSALSAFAAHRLRPLVRVLAGREGHWPADRLAALLRAVPDAVIETDLSTLRRLSSRGALAGCPPQTDTAVRLREDRRRSRAGLQRACTGRGAPPPVTVGVEDLWWEHDEPVTAHERWLGSVVDAGGTVRARRPDAASVAHAAVHDIEEVCAPGAYGTASDRPDLVWIESAEPVLVDIDQAWRHGRCHSRLFDPGALVAGLCRLGHGPCPASTGRQLYVEADGTVLLGRAGPAVGKTGDDLNALRAEIRALPAAANGCRCRPEGMADADRPWLGRVLDAALAVAALSGEHPRLFEPTGRAGLRVSGCGGPLTHASASRPNWPASAAMLQFDDRYYLHAAGRAHRLAPALAAAVEIRLDRPDDAAETLARDRRLAAATAAKAVAAAEAALAATGVLPAGKRTA
ncbi:hypothetical protein K3N28_20875 [Glycomyces sp. TRM65418]|uniref:hypothetical protein n=1 Tax=Glycomyces sp. TRM65418 TaxID=2867006 RepID=UPI001CE4EBEB|nr:hypothetical protein [Glycomyces sp. TRM65418]MCC3765519.1 hypothetical protein [Glycomyces sp. TRM65418]QZD55126.1 hypothetical protein K3N28_20770 [Glycomyces sp. TRM65418]